MVQIICNICLITNVLKIDIFSMSSSQHFDVHNELNKICLILITYYFINYYYYILQIVWPGGKFFVFHTFMVSSSYYVSYFGLYFIFFFFLKKHVFIFFENFLLYYTDSSIYHTHLPYPEYLCHKPNVHEFVFVLFRIFQS